MQGVWNTESGNRHHDDKGNVIRGPMTRHGQAIGVSQLMEGTARGHGGDPFDETQNRTMGKAELAAQFQRYGNWEDALAAYNWGSGNVDKWIADGRDPAKMPAETRAYIPKVLASVGVEAAPPGSPASNGEELRRTASSIANGGVSGPSSNTSDGEWRSPLAAELRAPRAIENLLELPFRMERDARAMAYGVMRGLADLALSPLQWGAERVAPETATQLTQQVNDLDATVREQLGMRGETKGGVFETVGHVTGSTLGILAGAGMIGNVAPAAAEDFQAIPRLLRLPAGAAIYSGTKFNEDPNYNGRWLDAAIGATGGVLGLGVARSLEAANRYAANSGAHRSFMEMIRQGVADLTPSTTRLRDVFVRNYRDKLDQQTAHYTLRNAQGQALPTAFPRDSIAEAPARAFAASTDRGISITPAARTTAGEVDRHLGGQQARAAQAAHEQAVRDHAAAAREWQRTYVGRDIDSMPPHVVAQMMQRVNDDVARGIIPPPPAAPAPFVPPPVTAEQFEAASQAIGRAFGRARDRQTRHQLAAMQREMRAGATEAAREAGMNVDDFLRQMNRANQFHRDEIVPLYRFTHNRSPDEVLRDMTPAKFYDTARRLIEGNDVDALRAFRKLVGGERADGELFRIAMHRAVTAADEGGARVTDYFTKHREQLDVLLSRDAMREFEGMAKIADRLISQPDKHSKMWSAVYYPIAGRMAMAHGLFTGDALSFGAGAATAYGVPLVRTAAASAMARLRDIGAGKLFARASHMHPDSAALDTLIQTITRRAEVAAAVGSSEVAGSRPAQAVKAPLAQTLTPAPVMAPIY
jgi:hypothetical protein